jgi:hypothetical protein
MLLSAPLRAPISYVCDFSFFMAVTVNHPSSAPAHDSHGSHARASDVHVVRRVYLPNLEMRQPMAKFIVLSLLLHVWMVLLFGNTGGERANQAKFGSFFARLNPAAGPSASPAPTAVASLRSAPTKATRSRVDPAARNEAVAEAKPDSPSPTPAPAPVTQPSPTVTAAAESPTRVEPVAPVAPIEPIQSLPEVSVRAPVIAVPILAVESPTLPTTAPTFVVPLLPSQAANTVEPTKIEPLAVPLLVAPSNLPKSIEPVQTPLLVAPIQTLLLYRLKSRC